MTRSCMSIAAALSVFLANNFAFSQNNAWQQTNGPYGGYVQAMAADSNGHVFAGTWESGIFRSTDDGETWISTNAGFATNVATTWIGCVAVTRSGHVFLGGLPDSGPGRLYRSTDNGEHWIQLNPAISVGAVVSLVSNSLGYVYAGTTSTGVFRSTDNGDNWAQLSLPYDNKAVWNLAFSSNGVLFATVGDQPRFGVGGAIWRSTDSGASWTQSFSTTWPVSSLAANSTGDVFAGTSGMVYKSTDNGINWSPTTKFSNFWTNALCIDKQGHVFAGTDYEAVFRSTDKGATWTRLDKGLTDYWVWSLTVTPKGTVFAGTTEGGVYRRTLADTSWIETHMNSSTVSALLTTPTGLMFAGTHFGVFRSSDGGSNWSEINNNLGSLDILNRLRRIEIVSLAVNSRGTIFAGANGEGIFLSTNNGDDWTTPQLQNKSLSCLAVNSQDQVFAAGATSGGVYRSTDNGASWTLIGLASYSVGALFIHPDGAIFAGCDGGLLFRSKNDHGDWEQLSISLPQDALVSSIVRDSKGQMFLGAWAPYVAGFLFRSTDNGTSWQRLSVDLIHSRVQALAVNSIGKIYCATSYDGVLYSADAGTTWTQSNVGLTHTDVLSVTFNAAGYAVAGTYRGGIFKSSLPTPVEPKRSFRPFIFSLRQNYPNPFNSTTEIQFSLPESGFLTLRVFNLLGQEIETILSTNLEPGSHMATWSAVNVPTGVYFYQLRFRDLVETKKLILLK